MSPQQCSVEEEEKEFSGPIPKDKVILSYVKGSGPGGQNVNKCKKLYLYYT